jgi:hypothetical protein
MDMVDMVFLPLSYIYQVRLKTKGVFKTKKVEVQLRLRFCFSIFFLFSPPFPPSLTSSNAPFTLPITPSHSPRE